MDITTILETVTPISLSYFFIGGLAGYLLRVYSSNFRSKRPGRYQTTKTDASVKRFASLDDSNVPAFELPDSVLKTLTPSRLSGAGIDENINEFQ
ncbi:MAG: hypothetical protein IPN42_14240 [Methylococcaceae bacterium]|nr:hypothetical protein [Methylococcaceae bacterium]